ncbi:MAG: PAS domain S-box protein [Gammaproteobacteria bacterium]|nr:PAS domain S-box protein [Gammaproteobacteria bacterium]
MNNAQILQVLYEMALVTGSETHVEPLITKTLQRLLYHTAFPCGLFLSGIKKNEGDADAYVEQVIGCGVLRKYKGSRLILPGTFLDRGAKQSNNIENIFKEKLKYKTALRLPVSEYEQFILLNISTHNLQLPFERIFEPVLTNFGKTLSLCRENERYTKQLEQEIERRDLLETSLRESETRYRTIFESTVDGIINIDTRGVIESVNSAVEKLFGYKKSELIGKSISMLMPEPYSSQHNIFISKFKQTGHSTILGVGRELTALKKDGTVFPVDIALDEMIIDDKHMFTGIIRDISERKEAEKNLVRAKEDAEYANLAKSTFLSSMSHELRTPLNAILGFSQLIELDSKEDFASEYAKEIIKGGELLLALTNDVLDLSKIESGNVDLSIESLSLNNILGEVLSLVHPLSSKRDIKINNKVSSCDDVEINVDEIRFKQVLLNVLSNAIKYNHQNGIVTIEYVINDSMLHLSVADTGKGLTPEQQVNIFEPFERAGAEKSNIEGTGLGLVITKNLLEHMNGNITVESKPGKGSCFCIIVPLA